MDRGDYHLHGQVLEGVQGDACEATDLISEPKINS